VSDTGQGIGAEFLPHVFETFRQADSAITRQHGGLGLGLAIVRYLTELHGGKVEARSAGEGLGASFIVTLPLLPLRVTDRGLRVEKQSSLNSAVHSAPSAILAGVRVLVVDDDEDAREMIRLTLERCGAEARVAVSVVEALRVLDEWRPDVIVSDIGMPEEDGYDLIRRVRARDAGSGGRIPAVALTAYAREEDRQRALEAGYQMHVAKPVEPLELTSALASVTGRAEKV
jgi:CheY-like chemotaxis protein